MNQNKTVTMGFAQTDITPEKPVEMVGFYREDNISRGIQHPLSAQVSVWHCAEETCCLITIDSIGFMKHLANGLRDRIGQVIGIPREKVMLCFSHTHAAPDADREPAYYEMVCRCLEDAAHKALQQMHLVTIGWGNGEAEIGCNRRTECSSIDSRAGILKVCDAESGALRLLLVRLTAHCNVLKSDNYLISPDYFGAVRDLLQETYHCPVMLVQGAAGNVAPKYYCSKNRPADASDGRFVCSHTALEDMAQAVLDAVKPVIGRIQTGETASVKMYSRQISLWSEVPYYERGLQIAEEAERECGIDGTLWLAEVKRLLDRGIYAQEDVTEVQYFSLGKGCLCGVPNEIMTEFALEVSEMLDNPCFYFNGYTNGCTGYFPTEAEFDKGGYEVYWSMLTYFSCHGRVFPLNREAAGQLREFVVENAPEA